MNEDTMKCIEFNKRKKLNDKDTLIIAKQWMNVFGNRKEKHTNKNHAHLQGILRGEIEQWLIDGISDDLREWLNDNYPQLLEI